MSAVDAIAKSDKLDRLAIDPAALVDGEPYAVISFEPAVDDARPLSIAPSCRFTLAPISQNSKVKHRLTGMSGSIGQKVPEKENTLYSGLF